MTDSRPAFALRPVSVVTAIVVIVLTALSARYGYHRDELYFLTAGDHLAWGYVDQPPLTPLLSRLSTAVFGDTVMGLRVIATLAAAGIVVTMALISRELGGSARAQTLAAVAVAVSGQFLAVGHMVSTATFDLLAWLAIGLFALKLLRTGDGRWWIALGLTLGLAVQNKYLVLLLVAALLVAQLVVGPRTVFRSRWLLAGVAVALVVAGPNLYWQAINDWPQLTVASGISEDDGVENRLMFIPLQLAQLSPVLVPFWIAGFVHLARRPEFRAVAYAYPLLAVLVLAIGGKPYYALPLLLVLVAAGCEPVVRWAEQPVRRGVLAAGLALAAITSAVITLPVLPASALDAITPINKEQAEQVGWPELADAVAAGWAQIPADQRDRAVIFTQNYGEAGAIERFGPSRGLPTLYSGHMSYWDWAAPPDSATGPVLLVQYPEAERALERHFTDCRVVGTVSNAAGIANGEEGAPIALCAGPIKPWSALWPELRRFY
ncbi:glycosyltransferase family 39 protein [Kribbella sp. NBC_01245]|uniref:ArnT family glycosyltransferase n=1 Tax=Kribbella sp. NBC_01245 TaxID=2903578 RepID=UPI002E27F334|nr:glycosyltransferase family 39 protein [Kribbella sp. NBC_01245]